VWGALLKSSEEYGGFLGGGGDESVVVGISVLCSDFFEFFDL
jgi:hypothetical protein